MHFSGMLMKGLLILLFLLFTNISFAKIEPVVQQGHNSWVASVVYSPDGRFIASVSWDSTIKIWDADTGKLIRTLKGHSWFVNSVAYSPDGRFIASGGWAIKIWNARTGKLIATLMAFPDASVVITPEGYFSGTGKFEKYVHFVDTETLKVYTLDQYYETFYRPDLVKLALKGQDLSQIAKLNINQVKPAPEVEIIDTPNQTKYKEITITVKITEQGGGIGSLVVYLNGSAIRKMNISQPPELITRDIRRKLTIPLEKGKNKIQVKVYNFDNTQVSRPAVHEVVYHKKEKEKPNLYGVIIGINEFRNYKLNLRYAKADALELSETLGKLARKSGLYKKVKLITLTSREETTKDHILKVLNQLKGELSPKDVFVFFVASHGTVIDGKYYLYTSNVGHTSDYKIMETAISQDDLTQVISNLPATKKILMFDTCQSGRIADAMVMAMLTRGLDEETAMSILNRAVGAIIMSASKDYQYALEGYKGHGIFTYAVIEGLKGEANSDGDLFLLTRELATYLDSKIPEIAKKVYRKEQFPHNVGIKDQSFPILKYK